MLRLPTLEGFTQACANLLTIADKATNALVPFQLRDEQLRIARAILSPEQDPAHVAVCKSRQIGSSTVLAALVAMIAIANPGIQIGIAANTEATSKQLLNMVYRFVWQLDAPIVTHNKLNLIIGDSGSDPTQHTQIIAQSATRQVANDQLAPVFAGFNLSFAWVSELAFFESQTAFSSITSAASKGIIVAESTPNGSTGAGATFHGLFESDASDWDRIFFSVEDSVLYTADPASISDQEWAEAVASYGFTSRPHAAWWLSKRNSEGLSDLLMYRSFPVQMHHAWDAAREAFFEDTVPELAQVQTAIPFPDAPGYLEVFCKPEESLAYVVGVDVSQGRGKDYSALAVLEMGTGKLAASYRNNECELNQLIKVLTVVEKTFPVSEFVIESNGIGGWVCEQAEREGLPVRRHNTTTTPVGQLLKIKNLVRKGILKGGLGFKEECSSIYMDERGRFKGRKDLLYAISFVIEEALDFAEEIPLADRKSGHFYLDGLLES